jgi:hypothetical protein
MTEVVAVSKDPTDGKRDLTEEDIYAWWSGLRSDVDQANAKLIAIRKWWQEQMELIAFRNAVEGETR